MSSQAPTLMRETHGDQRIAGELSQLSDNTEFIMTKQPGNDYVSTWKMGEGPRGGYNHNNA